MIEIETLFTTIPDSCILYTKIPHFSFSVCRVRNAVFHPKIQILCLKIATVGGKKERKRKHRRGVLYGFLCGFGIVRRLEEYEIFVASVFVCFPPIFPPQVLVTLKAFLSSIWAMSVFIPSHLLLFSSSVTSYAAFPIPFPPFCSSPMF